MSSKPLAGYQIWARGLEWVTYWYTTPVYLRKCCAVCYTVLHWPASVLRIGDSPGLTWFITMILNTLSPGQHCRHFACDISKCIFLNGNTWISLKISLNCVPKLRIKTIPTLFQVMVWHRSCDKPLSEPIMNICATRSQWVRIENKHWFYKPCGDLPSHSTHKDILSTVMLNYFLTTHIDLIS